MHVRLCVNKAISRQVGLHDADGCQPLRDKGSNRRERGQRERTGRRGRSERTEGGKNGHERPRIFPINLLYRDFTFTIGFLLVILRKEGTP